MNRTQTLCTLLVLASVNLSVVPPLADDVVVNGAKLENGMLYIALERIIPEEKKPLKLLLSMLQSKYYYRVRGGNVPQNPEIQ